MTDPNSRLHLAVIITSTRPGRAGLPIGKWFFERAQAHGGFEVELVDLAEINLPMFDEPRSPRLRQYEHAHTRAWSQRIDAADAFAFVMPEYNYAMPPSMVNAVDFLAHEWSYKPATLVAYGGLAAGQRAAQMAKQLLTAVKIMPIPEGVAIPFFNKQMVDGAFHGDETHQRSADAALNELVRWARALKTMRTPA